MDITGLKILSSQKFNEYFHRTSLIKLTQVCFLSLHIQKVSAHCTRQTTLYLYSILYYMQYSTWTSVFSVLKTSCIWSLKPLDNISSASSKTNNLMLLVPKKTTNFTITLDAKQWPQGSHTSIRRAPNINSTHLTLDLWKFTKKEIISINRSFSKLLNLWLGAQMAQSVWKHEEGSNTEMNVT